MSEKPNDSPAFRLRPRAEPKSYYSIRLEYSANPAAFTRERPRSSGAKKRSSSTKSSYSRAKQQSNKLTAAAQSVLRHDNNYAAVPLPPVKLENVVSKEDIEREERHKQLRREISQSITTNTMISPFMQRLPVDELKPSVVYDQNYITLKIEKVITMPQSNADARVHIVCKCSRVAFDDEDDEMDDDDKNPALLDVHLFDEYANENLLKVGKILNIAKFKTGPNKPAENNAVDSSNDTGRARFDVIVRYDEFKPEAPLQLQQDALSVDPESSSSTETSNGTDCNSPLIPFVSITDMIEHPTEPFVEMAPPSPVPLPNKDHSS